jgi:hypothetical protein
MKPHFFMAVTFLMAFAACGGDVKTSATEPEPRFCEKLCACEGCSDLELDTCEDNQEDTKRIADEEGCGASFASYLSCAAAASCKDGKFDVDGCNNQQAALSQCLGSTPTCPTVGNGVCDEPEGSNTCAEGSDPNDCATPSGDCTTYCSTIQSNCTGSNAQFSSMDTCLATCATLPLGMNADLVGNSVGCRTYHGTAAQMDPDTHCIHAGPSGGGVCGDYCESFCAIVPKLCPSLYPTTKECMFECSQLPNAEPYDASDTSGDSFACRLYHATIASVDPATHCPHVVKASPVCK